jgi:DmsE family decaheme c-type cytochrome
MFSSKRINTVARVGAGLAVWIFFSWLAPTSLAQKAYDPAGMPGAEYADRGAETCMKCHDEAPVTHILYTAHAQRADERTPFASHDCETCHGPSPEHLIKPAEGEKRASPSVVFGKNSNNSPQERNAICLGCHQGGEHIAWQGSPHQFADLTCASCHQVHALRDRVRVKSTQSEVCFECHRTQRAQVLRLSSHPIREGLVVCADCHNPHGSFGPKQLVKATLNDTCYQCHTEKRGPFLWEHPPVREDCSNCHTPHGSTQPSLLKARGPWLCQTCHAAEFHPSTAYSGTGIPPSGAARQLLAKNCLNCHSQVHGSNHPSGVRFMR